MLSPDPVSHKDALRRSGRGPLAGYSLLACAGPEAGAFLQAQLMNDVLALAPGQWQWNGWLNPKGRVICLFALWRRHEQDFLLLLPDFPATELQPLLQRYVFRSKLRLSVCEEFDVRGEFGGDAAPGARDFAQAQQAGWSLDFGGDALARRLVLLARDDMVAAETAIDDAWREADLAHGLVRLDAGQRESWTPQMLSLQRLRAFSLAKGCYPGQEIVARTHYLGQSKRELARLQGEELAAGAAITGADGRALGTVVSASADGRSALAVLQAERAPGDMRAGAAGIEEAPLLEGLQRPA